MVLASIPSPDRGVWYLGPLPIRAYAFCIILGVLVAVYLGNRRWVARGGRPGTVADVAVLSVPLGIVGARLYHVATNPELYFGSGRSPIDAVKIWHGGLGIWGGIALGAIGAWIACSRRGISIAAFGDAVAPGIAVAQAIGRLGNYFNQELYGRATDLPWALHITRPESGSPGYYHPTFLYELLWDLGVAALVLWADRRYRLGGGRAFALYVAAYTLGRLWIEALRVDHANHILGVRLNIWTSALVFLGAVGYLIAARHRGRETGVEVASDHGAATPAG
ncbi:MAG: prolipoprotein diacylglyceryl transferase [Frankiaceae bacterium]